MIKKNLFFLTYILISIAFIFISAETLLSLYFKSVKIPTDNRFKYRYMLYSEGKLFKRFDNFFKYHPNLNKRSLQFYFKDNQFIKIWDYEFETNNNGLVQSFDIFPNKKSILILGDSLAEGQGDQPWIDKFGESFLGYQMINGGIIGIGFQQFENIAIHLKKKFNVEKTIVLYIGGDLRRGLVLLSDTECLLNNDNCLGNFSFYSIPKNENDLNKFLKDIHELRQKENLSLKLKIKYLIRGTYSYNILRSQINTIRLKNNKTIKKNLRSIDNLFKENKDKIVFVNIKTAEEIIREKESYETKLIKKYLNDRNIPSLQCDMNNDISNFYKIDLHPNEKGHQEIFLCVKKIIEKF